MTRIEWDGPKGKNADYVLTITGHTSPEACAALTALWYSFTKGIERLAEIHPDDVKLYRPAGGGTKKRKGKTK
jgi:hypothetical protein